MSLIEGFGDEVVEVFAILFIVILCLVAWRSTAIREFPQIRTVLILERRSQNSSSSESRNVTESTPADRGTEEAVDPVNERSSVSSIEEPDSIQGTTVGIKDAEGISNSTNDGQPSCSNAGDRMSNPGPSSSSNESNRSREQSSMNGEEIPSSNLDPEKSIRVKLKYLNDNQKIVQGNLEELLGAFKRRYFEAELSNNQSVLLIFKGQVLSEERTLVSHGLYDNCVVHCLIKAGGPQGPSASPVRPPEEVPEWNLGAVLSSTISVMLAAAWLAQIGCPQIFTISTTSALISLTALFALSVVVIHFPQYLPTSTS